MFSSCYMQTQVLSAVSELSFLLNLPRVCVSLPTRRKHAKPDNVVHSKVLEENTVLKDILQENTLFQQLPKCPCHKELCPLLSVECGTVCQLCSRKQNGYNGGLWRERFVSTETFFENKTGFPESQIKIQDFNNIGLSIGRQNKELHQRFLQASIQHLFFQQIREFKTKRGKSRIELSGRYEKMGEAETEEIRKPYFFSRSPGKFSDAEKEEIKRLYYMAKDEVKNLKIMIKVGILILTWIFMLYAINLIGRNMRTPVKSYVNTYKGKLTFADVKGAEEAKEELQDIVAYLKNPKKYSALGGKLPKGVLLVGPPGTGKTLLARAVAGEAGVYFLYGSCAKIDQALVGSGTKNVKMLFEKAKRRKPVVLFLDEIDVIGKERTTSSFYPYANATINQLLSEMDGFKKTEGIIVIAATNRADVLDKALLRSGRFDVQVKVSPPDLKGRKEILKLYLGKVKASDSIDVHKIARGTATFTGADLENLVNTAAFYAAKERADKITMEHIEFAKDKIMMGPSMKTKILDENQRWTTAYHEAGHTVVSYFTKGADPVHKVTILPRGQSLGFTSSLPETDVYGYTKSELLAKIDVCMGGRVGEELIYGSEKITTGVGSDIKQATNLATAMVEKLGMSEKVGIRSFKDKPSEDAYNMIDREISRILQESYKRTKDLLQKYAKQHKMLAEALMEYETLDSKDIKDIMEGRKINKNF